MLIEFYKLHNISLLKINNLELFMKDLNMCSFSGANSSLVFYMYNYMETNKTFTTHSSPGYCFRGI